VFSLTAAQRRKANQYAKAPAETIAVFSVGYLLVPEERRDQTMLHFRSTRGGLQTSFEAVFPKVVELPQALREEGLDHNVTNSIVIGPEEAARDLEAAAREAEAKNPPARTPSASPRL